MRNVFIGLWTLLSLSFAHAFTLNSSTNSSLKGWDKAEIRLAVNTSNCPTTVDVVGIIRDAADLWNNVPDSNVSVTYEGYTSTTTMTAPTTVYCETNSQAVTGADQNAVPGAAAVDGSTGTITRGILYLNVSAGRGNIAGFDQTTLKVILAHEIGHILGLGHSSDSRALMYFDASAKTELSLAQDDMDGVAYLYPSDETKGKQMAGCALIKRVPPPSGGNYLMFFMSLLLPLAIWLSQRNRNSSFQHLPADFAP